MTLGWVESVNATDRNLINQTAQQKKNMASGIPIINPITVNIIVLCALFNYGYDTQFN